MGRALKPDLVMMLENSLSRLMVYGLCTLQAWW
jgi:hypothetical protein